jgi:hypothetical protein
MSGTCTNFCGSGLSACSGTCTNVKTDNNNCGACATAGGAVCPSGKVCTAGACVAGCAAGQSLCNGACIDTSANKANCGACGTVCAANQVCSAGSCVVDCSASLINPITDQWGLKMDSVERSTSLYAGAAAQCAAIGGRLPTPTELWRVSAGTWGGVGETYQTNWLWTDILSQVGYQTVVRLSDGNTSEDVVASTQRTFRCVCPVPTNSAFTGSNCFGPPGSSCFTLSKMEGGKLNLDNYDRAPVRSQAAILECATEHAHLATIEQLSTAVLAGLPNGSSNGQFNAGNYGTLNWLHTAEMGSSSNDMLLRWTGVAPGFTYGTSEVTWSTLQDFRPFRCAGQNIVPVASAAPANGVFVDTNQRWVFDANDQAPVQYEFATDDCTSRGGHLPSGHEIGEGIYAGLPNGTGAWNLGSDNCGYYPPNHDFLTSAAAWKDAATFNFYSTGATQINWEWKNLNVAGPYPHRCIYYPIDPGYAGPLASSCQGGTACFKVTLAARTHMWFDANDRPGATNVAAVAACQALGAHVASERDLTEAIRAGLPNGQNTYLWTTDMLSANSQWSFSYPINSCVRWTGVNKSFQDEYYYSTPAYEMNDCNYIYNQGITQPYRCMWSDELR